MCRECYELELPEPTWAERFQEDKELIKFAGVAIGIPTVLFVASCILHLLAKKGD